MNSRHLFLILLLLALPPVIHAGDGDVTFIHIGDLHGHLVPRPNMREGDATQGQMVGGLAYVYDQIKKIRQRHPNSLLINTGDTIQGSAEVLYSRGQHIVDILNEFQIDAFTPGNWDFVYGTERFIELFAGRKPVTNWNAVAANLYYVTLYEFPLTPYPERAGTRVVPPYLIKQVGDVTVGILGLTADRGPQAVSTRIMDGFYLSPGEEELADGVDILRNQEKVDLVVLISERGLAANLDMVERIPGVDLVLSSDMHEETHNVLVSKSGTLLVEEGQDGTLVGEINLNVHAGKIFNWTWKAHRITTKNNQPDPTIAAMVENARKTFVKGRDFHPHVNPINATILRTPIDTVIGHTKVALHRSNFADATAMPAVIEGSSHDFLADAFKFACDAEVGMMRGFRYGTHIAPGPIKLEDIYHYVPIGPQIACGKISGDELWLRIEKSADGVLTNWISNWGGGWLIAYSGITYELDPSNEYRHRVSNMRINGELLDPARMYNVAGYWYLDNADRINRMPAIDIKVLKDAYGADVDATEIVAYYLQTLPSKTVNPNLNRVRLMKPLPKPISKNKEIQPLKGYPRPDY
jgi:sulfur-oxidizing protein SoxB